MPPAIYRIQCYWHQDGLSAFNGLFVRWQKIHGFEGFRGLTHATNHLPLNGLMRYPLCVRIRSDQCLLDRDEIGDWCIDVLPLAA